MADVVYGIKPVEKLPDRASGGGRTSALNELIIEFRTRVDKGEFKAGSAAVIARYPKPQTASAAAASCRKRWGTKPDAYGLTFRTAKVKESDGSERTGLFVSYDKSKVVAGASDAVNAEYRAWRDKQMASRKEKLAANGSATKAPPPAKK